MNVNAKNLIRLRALSPRNSVNVKIENVNVVEREKTHIQSRVKRFRENKKGGWKPTHIIELQGRVICVYGLESNNKTEYAVTCGGINEAKELWNELFSDNKTETEEGNNNSLKLEVLPAEIVNESEFTIKIKNLLNDSPSNAIIIKECNDIISFVSNINISFTNRTDYNSLEPVVRYERLGSISVMRNGAIRFINNYNMTFLFTEFLDNPDEAKRYLFNKFSKYVVSKNDIYSSIESLILRSIQY